MLQQYTIVEDVGGTIIFLQTLRFGVLAWNQVSKHPLTNKERRINHDIHLDYGKRELQTDAVTQCFCLIGKRIAERPPTKEEFEETCRLRLASTGKVLRTCL
jgi:hypothetical protein